MLPGANVLMLVDADGVANVFITMATLDGVNTSSLSVGAMSSSKRN
jgi:hypothetical protein